MRDLESTIVMLNGTMRNASFALASCQRSMRKGSFFACFISDLSSPRLRSARGVSPSSIPVPKAAFLLIQHYLSADGSLCWVGSNVIVSQSARISNSDLLNNTRRIPSR